MLGVNVRTIVSSPTELPFVLLNYAELSGLCDLFLITASDLTDKVMQKSSEFLNAFRPNNQRLKN